MPPVNRRRWGLLYHLHKNIGAGNAPSTPMLILTGIGGLFTPFFRFLV